LWRPDAISLAEQEAFRDVLHDVNSVGDYQSLIGKRMVISQHFATAVNRFDGQNQRLRLAIEEIGLVPLVGSRWQPTVTEDRLPMLLSLAADCTILGTDGDGGYLSVEQSIGPETAHRPIAQGTLLCFLAGSKIMEQPFGAGGFYPVNKTKKNLCWDQAPLNTR
jgi:hypothetical protein